MAGSPRVPQPGSLVQPSIQAGKPKQAAQPPSPSRFAASGFVPEPRQTPDCAEPWPQSRENGSRSHHLLRPPWTLTAQPSGSRPQAVSASWRESWMDRSQHGAARLPLPVAGSAPPGPACGPWRRTGARWIVPRRDARLFPLRWLPLRSCGSSCRWRAKVNRGVLKHCQDRERVSQSTLLHKPPMDLTSRLLASGRHITAVKLPNAFNPVS